MIFAGFACRTGRAAGFIAALVWYEHMVLHNAAAGYVYAGTARAIGCAGTIGTGQAFRRWRRRWRDRDADPCHAGVVGRARRHATNRRRWWRGAACAINGPASHAVRQIASFAGMDAHISVAIDRETDLAAAVCGAAENRKARVPVVNADIYAVHRAAAAPYGHHSAVAGG